MELGLDSEPIIEHFKKWTPEENLRAMRERCREELKANNIIK
jgi:hypothetical protein